MALKVHISPYSPTIERTNGVAQVIHAQYSLLPKLGIELVEKPEDADIVAAHIFADHLPNVDVMHYHGLLWSADYEVGSYPESDHDVNRRIVNAARRASLITFPSEWSTMAMRRDMRISPVVIPNGVWLNEWEVKPSKGYALWNKNRKDLVCDPEPAVQLAMRGADVISTFGGEWEQPETLKIVGTMPHEQMKELVMGAEMYLSTTKEVCSLGVMEALASGVPVLAFDFGGNSEQIQHKVSGYLAKPGDYDDLFAGYEYIKKNRAKMSKAARKRATEFDWNKIIPKYAELYQKAFEIKKAREFKVSVIITSYNYGRYLNDAILSVLNQSLKPHEVIVVNDGSTDNTDEVAGKHPVKLISQTNQGVAAARNNGIKAATGELIVCLDADDGLHPDYLKILQAAFVADAGLGIAYTDMAFMDDRGALAFGNHTSDFSFEVQARPGERPSNCVPCAAMFKREAWARVGGYIQKYHPAEDADFWTRIVACGYLAKKASNEGLFLYRTHPGSASQTKPMPKTDTYRPWMQTGAYPIAAPSATQPLVRSYSTPLATFVIPVGPGHDRYLAEAIESVEGQTVSDWSLVIVNDTGALLDTTPYPYATVINTVGRTGAGVARNQGLAEVKTPFVVFLDADDYLKPDYLEKTLAAYAASEKYIYVDWLEPNGYAHEHVEYNQEAWVEYCLHNVTALIPTEQAKAVGGFDEKLAGFEDHEFFAKMAEQGYCGKRLALPLLYYRQDSGSRRENAHQIRDTLLKEIASKHKGVKLMACGSCGGNAPLAQTVQEALAKQPQPMLNGVATQAQNKSSVIKLEFTGNQIGGITFTVNGRQYTGAASPENRIIEVLPEDVDGLLSKGYWRQAAYA